MPYPTFFTNYNSHQIATVDTQPIANKWHQQLSHNIDMVNEFDCPINVLSTHTEISPTITISKHALDLHSSY